MIVKYVPHVFFVLLFKTFKIKRVCYMTLVKNTPIHYNANKGYIVLVKNGYLFY